MKLKRLLAGFLAGALVVTGIPVSGLGGISAEAAVQTDQEAGLSYRYRPVDENKITLESDIGASADNPDRPVSSLNRRSGYMQTNKIEDSTGAVHKNFYFTLENSRLLGSVSYLSAGPLGSITRCRVYVSNIDTPDAADIHGSGWLQVYETPEDAAWEAYSSDGNNRHEAVFDMAQIAKHVRIEVLETAGGVKGAEEIEANKVIAGERVLINEAGRLDQKEAEDDVALGTAQGGQTTIAAYTGTTSGEGAPENTINGRGDDISQEGRSFYWCPNKSHWQAGNTQSTVSYIIYDLHNLETDISKIKVRWHNQAWSGKYSIETSDTCKVGKGLGENVSADLVDAVELSSLDTEGWTTVAEYDAGEGNYEDMSITFPSQEFQEDTEVENLKLKTTKLKRYVRLVIKKANVSSGNKAALRAFSITGKKHVQQEAENVALVGESSETRIVGYSGEDTMDETTYSKEFAFDGKTGASNGSWTPSVLAEGKGINMKTGDKAYLVLDLGEGTITELSGDTPVKITWSELAAAKVCRVFTSDTYTSPAGGDEYNFETLGGSLDFVDNWEQVVTGYEGDTDIQYKEFAFAASDYTSRQLGRYVCFEFSGLNGQLKDDETTVNAAISEIEINGFRRTAENADVRLTVEEPSYGAKPADVQAYAAPAAKGQYLVDETIWTLTSNKNAATTDEKFGAKAYTMVVRLKSKNPFADLTNVTVNGMTAQPYTGSLTFGEEEAGWNYMNVYFDFDQIADPQAAYTALEEEVKSSERAANMARIAGLGEEAAFQEYTERSWLTFKEAYDYAVSLVGAYQAESETADGDDTAEDFPSDVVYYPESVYREALQELQANYTMNGAYGLKAASSKGTVDLSADDNNPKAVVTRSAAEQTVEMADVNAIVVNGEGSDAEFEYIKEKMPEENGYEFDKKYKFKVLPDNSFSGVVHAPYQAAGEGTEGKNTMFSMSGDVNNKFLIRCTLTLPEAVTHKQSVIGMLNGQWGIQLEGNELLIYGHNSGWPTTRVNISDMLGQSVEMVAYFGNGAFELYLGNKRGQASQPASGALVMTDNTNFGIGWNYDYGLHGDSNNSYRGGDFQYYDGSIKNFEMYTITQKESDSGWLADYATTIKPADDKFTNNVWNDSSTTMKEYFAGKLAGKTPNVSLSGYYSAYSLKKYTWLNADGAEVEYPSPYEDYTLKVEIQTNEKALDETNTQDLVFPEDAVEKNFLYTLDAEGNKVNVPEESLVEATKLADGDGTLVYTYASKGLPEPKETLRSWLADEANARKEASEASNYTRRSWQAYNAAYDRAEALMKSKLDRDQSVYEDALAALRNINDTLVEKTADTCECEIGSVVYNGPIEIPVSKASEDAAAETGSVDLAGNTIVRYDSYGCTKHAESGRTPDVEYVEGTGADNTVSGVVENGTLSVTGSGQVKVTVRATYGDQVVTKDIMFTTISSAEKEEAKKALDAAHHKSQEAYNTNNRKEDGTPIYTADSWRVFQERYGQAESKYTAGTDNYTTEQLNALAAEFNDALAGLKTVERQEAENEAVGVLSKVETVNKGYTEESWQAYLDLVQQLRDKLEDLTVTPDELKGLAKQVEEYEFVMAPTEEEIALEAAKKNVQTALDNAVKDSESSKYSNWDGYAALKKQLEEAMKNPAATAAELNDLLSKFNAYKLVLKSGGVTPDPGPNPGPGPGPAPRPNPTPVENFVNVKNVRYELDKKNPKVAVAVKILKDAKSVTIQKTVKINGKSYKVEKIGASAFKGLKKLTSVTVGVNVKTIEKQAFMNCKKLKKVTLSNGKALKTIGSKAFKGTKKGLTVKAKKLKKAKDRKALLKKVKKAGAKSAKVTK